MAKLRTSISIPWVTIVAVASLGVGAGVAWAVTTDVYGEGSKGLVLAHELETMGLCTSGLTLIESDSPEKLSTLLRTRLDSAVARSSALVDQGATLGIAGPNLRESARRAAEYLDRGDDPGLARKVEILLAELAPE